MNSVHKKIAEAIKNHTVSLEQSLHNLAIIHAPPLIKDIADILEEEDSRKVKQRLKEGIITNPENRFNKTQFLKIAGCEK